MPETTAPPVTAAQPRFEPESVRIDGDRVVVTGRWFDVRGLRFLRPALVVDGRTLLAALDHKPWAPGGDRLWTAAFPWDGSDDAALDGALLAVAPRLIVPLQPARQPQAAPHGDPARAGDAHDDAPTPVAERDAPDTELGRARDRLAEQQKKADALREATVRERRFAHDAVRERDEAQQARVAAERERDHARAQRDEAIRDRQAAVRAHRRMQAQRDEAIEARRQAESERAAALADRDGAADERDRALRASRDAAAERDRAVQARDAAVSAARGLKAERDDAVLARRAAERQRDTALRAWRELERDRTPAAHDPAPAPEGSGTEPGSEPGPSQPAVEPAADAPAAGRPIPTTRERLRRLDPARRSGLPQPDLWALRALATGFTACLIVLLILLVRAIA